jgi:hypothetical protein
MGKFLQLIWACKVLLTAGTTWRYCSENLYSPFCGLSGFYCLVIFVSLFVGCGKQNGFQVLEAQETVRLRSMEEGFQEIFLTDKENEPIHSAIRAAQRKWKEFDKGHHSE